MTGRIALPTLVAAALLVAVILAAFGLFGPGPALGTVLQGLTIASLLFLVAAGLSLIYGLGNVLNLGHTAVFMLGAYVAAQFSLAPGRLLGILVHPVALGVGLAAAGPLAALYERLGLRRSIRLGQVIFAVFLGVAVLAWFSAAPTAVPLGDIVPVELEPLPGVLTILLASFASAAGRALMGPHSGRLHVGRRSAALGIAAVLAVLLAAWADPLGTWISGWNGNVRFAVAILLAALVGAAVGAAMEVGLLRQLYSRYTTQVIMTLFVLIVLVELVQVFFGRNTLSMPRPDYFAGGGDGCPAASILGLLGGGCSSVALPFGVQTATYRFFIMLTAFALFVGVGEALRRSRVGMQIRAGVEDADMVSTLGVDVERVFTRVFVFGSAMAAFGGGIAAPFLGASPTMALQYLVLAFIVLFVGGLGSYKGAAVGALLVGILSALGDQIVLTAGLSPSFAQASALLILAGVLLLRPYGLYGQVPR